jgi:hypothetical protein
MKSPLETRSGIGKAITSFNSYVVAINESESYNSEEVNKKIKRAILWLNLNANLYGRLLSHLDIYGSEELDPETMCTNGISIIFHPKFVNSQSDEALRLVLAHEVLHCMFQHNTRRENRDPQLWNVACDYAINPLLIHDDNFNSGKWKMPIIGGKEAGLYERKYAGMRAEDIYQILLDEGAMEDINRLMDQAAMGEVADPDADSPEAGEGLEVQEGRNGDDEGESGQGEDGAEPGKGEGDGQGEPGNGEGEPGEGDGQGEPSDKGETNPLPKVGDEVILKSGGKGTVRRVHPNGDIEI